jgi:hypothetical protein
MLPMTSTRHFILCALCALTALLAANARAQFSAQFATAASLQPAQLAIVINDAEPNSVRIGEYYRKRRGIPAANVVHVKIPGQPREISAERRCRPC